MGRFVAERSSWEIVHIFCYLVTVILSLFLHALLFGEESADDAVMAFIRAPFTGTVWMAVIDLRDDGSEGIVITEL